MKRQLNHDDPRRLCRSLSVTMSAEKKTEDVNKRTAMDMIRCVSPTAIKPANLTSFSERQLIPNSAILLLCTNNRMYPGKQGMLGRKGAVTTSQNHP